MRALLGSGSPLTARNIAENKTGLGVSDTDIIPILHDFCRRDILRERDGEFEFVLRLFQGWLVEKGVTKLVADTLGDEIAAAIRTAENAAFVSAAEITNLVDTWPLYRGRKIGAEDVRRWLGQRKSFREQRLLFKLLQSLRFVSEAEVREKLRLAHSIVKSHTTAFTPESRSLRRYDVIVTYVDGLGKSGSRYADKYAEENLISTTCVVSPNEFSSKVVAIEQTHDLTISGVVIIDDIVTTGQSMSSNVTKFLNASASLFKDRRITAVVVALLATRDGEAVVRAALEKSKNRDVDFRCCETIEDRYFAFGGSSVIWTSKDEMEQAKQLVGDIGRTIDKARPFGFGDLALLVTLYDT